MGTTLLPVRFPNNALLLLQGIIPSLRKEAWKFLLGFYPWNSTTKEREDILRTKTSVTPPPGSHDSASDFC